MDVQLKKGMLDLMVLASLKYEDSYGYLINQSLNEVFIVSESTLYPILRRLEKQGLVTTYDTIHNSRLRRYYRISETGKEKLGQSRTLFRELKKIYDYILR